MAITQVTTVTIDGITIGLSDTIGSLISNGEFTVENLTPYMICGQLNKLCPKYGSLTGAERSYNGSAGSLPAQFPNVNTGSAGGVTVEFAQDDNLALPHDMYGRNILIYGSLGTPQIYAITNDMTTSNLRLVTSIDFKKIYYDVDMAGVSVSFTKPDAKTIINYQSGSDGKIKTIDNDEDTGISVFSVVDDGNNAGWYCLIDDLFPKSNSYGVRWLQNTPQYMAGAYDSTYATLNDGWNNFTLDKTLWRWSEPAGYLVYGGEGGNWGESFVGYIDNGNNFYAYLNYTPYGGTMQCIADGLEYALNQLANAGLKFKWNNTWYKPVGEGGYITGYTDNMSETSDWDDIKDVTGNTVPIVPPGPTPPDPGSDDPWNGVDFGGSSGGGGAFAKFYYMTSTELANLRSWMNSNNVPEGFDPMAQVIGLSQVPVAISGSAPENVMFVNSAAIYSEGQNRVVDTGVATQRGLGRTIVFNLGSVEIPRRMQQRGEPYLDYSCAVELYLPFCGIFSLDTQAVMGRTITAQLVLDPTSGSITGYAWVSQDGQKLPVAYGSGQVGVDLPISAQQYGMSKAALSQANAAFAQSMFQTGMSLLTALGTKGAAAAESAGDAAYARGGRGIYSNVRNAEQGAMAGEVGTYVKTQASSNIVGGFMDWGRSLKEISYGNNTAVSGSFGGSYASWSNPFTAYVKIIRPKVQKPSNYNHTQAVPCVEARTVASCTGLIQCIGVDTSSISNATSIERDAIAAALSNGVYAGW